MDNTGLTLSENWVDLAYLDNPPMQNYRSKSETAIIVAGCLKYRSFQFFSPFQSSHFRVLDFCSPFRRVFFAASLGFVRRFNTGKHLLAGRKTCRQQ